MESERECEKEAKRDRERSKGKERTECSWKQLVHSFRFKAHFKFIVLQFKHINQNVIFRFGLLILKREKQRDETTF